MQANVYQESKSVYTMHHKNQGRSDHSKSWRYSHFKAHRYHSATSWCMQCKGKYGFRPSKFRVHVVWSVGLPFAISIWGRRLEFISGTKEELIQSEAVLQIKSFRAQYNTPCRLSIAAVCGRSVSHIWDKQLSLRKKTPRTIYRVGLQVFARDTCIFWSRWGRGGLGQNWENDYLVLHLRRQ